MKERLTELLRCPVDGGPLELHDSERRPDGEIISGWLVSAAGERYPIEGGVPRLTPPSSSDDSPDQEPTFETFSAKWERTNREELDQRYELQHAWYVERYGFETERGLAEFLGTRKRVLEAGVGLGGDSARFARLSDAEVVGIDLSSAIEIAYREFGHLSNLHFVQADLTRPPFAPRTFDFVSSDQVIHHTPDARHAFSALAGLLTPGGVIAVYVYKVKGMIRELVDTHVREATSSMSVEECMEFSAQVTELGRELSHLDAKVTLERGIPLLGIEPGEHDVQRLVYWAMLKCFWNDAFSENLNVLVNFDWYHPRYASRHTPEEVSAWCAESDLVERRLDVVESGISVLAERPANAD